MMHVATPTHKNNNNHTKKQTQVPLRAKVSRFNGVQHDCVVMIRLREDKEGGVTSSLHVSL